MITHSKAKERLEANKLKRKNEVREAIINEKTFDIINEAIEESIELHQSTVVVTLPRQFDPSNALEIDEYVKSVGDMLIEFGYTKSFIEAPIEKFIDNERKIFGVIRIEI